MIKVIHITITITNTSTITVAIARSADGLALLARWVA